MKGEKKMGLFDRLKKNTVTEEKGCVYSPVSGTAQTLESLNDGMFSEKIMGDGIVVVPSDGEFKAPVSGVVETAFPTGHAYGIVTDDGLEVMVHIGIDTVDMNGRGFSPHVKQGQRVRVGDRLVTVDLDAVKAAGHPTSTVVILTGGDRIAERADVETSLRSGDRIMKTA